MIWCLAEIRRIWAAERIAFAAVCSRPVKKLDDLAAANADLELIMFGQVAFISLLATEFGNCHLRPAIELDRNFAMALRPSRSLGLIAMFQ